MSKKSLLVLAMTLSMVAILAIGGTLAYFTDTTEVKTNVFTTGNVDIELEETFEQNSKLLPGVDVEKVVNVKNVGSENAYVRIHLAVPSMLDSGSEDQPQFAAYNNTLHWNFTKASLADGEWNWHSSDVNGSSSYGPGYPENGGDWFFYQTTVDGILYNVYVATYETALATGETADTDAIYKVFLDTKVTNEQMSEITKALKGNIKILVAAEGAQEAEYETLGAYKAFEDQFGTPTSTKNPFVTPAE